MKSGHAWNSGNPIREQTEKHEITVRSSWQLLVGRSQGVCLGLCQETAQTGDVAASSPVLPWLTLAGKPFLPSASLTSKSLRYPQASRFLVN